MNWYLNLTAKPSVEVRSRWRELAVASTYTLISQDNAPRVRATEDKRK